MIWKIIRALMGVCGGIMVYCGVSTSDYYVIELGMKEPAYVWWQICIGLMLMLPTLIFAIYDETQRSKGEE